MASSVQRGNPKTLHRTSGLRLFASPTLNKFSPCLLAQHHTTHNLWFHHALHQPFNCTKLLLLFIGGITYQFVPKQGDHRKTTQKTHRSFQLKRSIIFLLVLSRCVCTKMCQGHLSPWYRFLLCIRLFQFFVAPKISSYIHVPLGLFMANRN